MFQNFHHELHKEPGKLDVYKHVLLYLSKRLDNQKSVAVWQKPKMYKQGLYSKNNKSKLGKLLRFIKKLIVYYLVIGFLFMIFKRQKGLFFKWPKSILSK